MNNRWGRKTGVLASSLALAVSASACTSSGSEDGSAAFGSLDREDKGTLKVAYFNEEAFYMQYGNAFQAMFPNLELEVVSTENAMSAEDPVAGMEQLIQDEQPDALFLTEDQYASLSAKGMLYDLDAAVKQDEFDLEAFVPSVIDLLKARGGGKLYGLSPSFASQALYYNKDLFDKHGIPYPTDGMSWEEVMQLAARFPVKKGSDNVKIGEVGQDDALYGLAQPISASDPFNLIRTIGEAKGLVYADSESKTVSIDTPEWKQIFDAVIAGYKSGSITMPSSGGGGGAAAMGGLMIRGMGGKTAISIGPNTMRFMNGQSAMSIDGPMIMNMLGMGASMGVARTQTKSAGGGAATLKPIGEGLNWDLVTIPTDPSQPGVSGSMSLDSVFSINAASENLSAAWEFLKYANGEQLAKTGAKSSPALTSRTAYKNEASGKNIDAFYSLAVNDQSLLQALPAGFVDSFAQLASDNIVQAVNDQKTVDEALKAIQSEGQDLLTQSLADEAQN